MKNPTPKYPGDGAMEKLLARYECPTPFHVLRLRALGEIVSLKSRVNPVDVIKSFWGDDFPSFKNELDAGQFFNAMLSHWNHMARHLSGTQAGGSARAGAPKVRLSKIARIKDWDHAITALNRRAEEIRDGFLAGFTTEQAMGSYPDALNTAITGLKTLADQFDQAARQFKTDRAALDQLDINTARTMITQGSTQVEKLLDVLCTVARALRGGGEESGEGLVH